MKPKPFFLLFVFFLSLAFLFCACSSSEPKIDAVSYSVVFDFADENTQPSVRLSVFVEADEIQRVENISVVHDETGLVWKIENPRKILAKDKKTWAGYTNLVAASGSKIPQGKYSVFYTQSSGEETDSSIYVSYPKDFEGKTAGAISSLLPVGYSEKIALYNSDNDLLYFANKKSAWQSNSDIKREYPQAVTKRQVFAPLTNSVVCMMPVEILPQSEGQLNTVHKEEKTTTPEK